MLLTRVNREEAGHGGSRLYSQHFGKPRGADRLRLGIQDQPGQHGETLFLLKNKKINWVCWCMPAIPATQENHLSLGGGGFSE